MSQHDHPPAHVHPYDEQGRMTCCILEESIEQFTFSEHLHRFACWTAARAVQRGFSAKIEDIQKAIDETELRTLVESRSLGHYESYDAFHEKRLDKNDYQLLIEKMKNISPNSFWKIEFLWP